MTQAKKGDTVKVHYRGTLTNGTEFDCSHGRDPLEFEVAAGMMIPGFDKAVEGMTVGEKKTVQIPAQEAYGLKNEDLMIDAPREHFPEGLEIELGMMFSLPQPGGHPVPVTVVKIDDNFITLDANHRLAGEDLIFEIELVSVA